MKYLKIILLTFMFVINNCTFADESSKLLKPTGKYKVSLITKTEINTDICPDYFYSVSDEWFYSKSPKHCHLINLLIYYPTLSNSTDYNKYFQYSNLSIENDIKNNKISKENLSRIKALLKDSAKIHGYVLTNKEIVKGQKFPLVIFQPGYDINSSNYENIITNLVSHGYIIVAIDSTYNQEVFNEEHESSIRPQTEFSVSDGIQSMWNKGANIDQDISDFKFVIDQIKNKKIKNQILESVDVNNIGGLGHSIGAYSVYNNAQKLTIKAGISLDMVSNKNIIETPANVPIPFMFIRPSHANLSELNLYGHISSFNLESNNYLVLMFPENESFSMHGTFTDISTMKHYKNFIDLLQLSYGFTFDHTNLGIGDGKIFIQAVNKYILSFFNKYLKNQKITNYCNARDATATIYCGPKKISYLKDKTIVIDK